MSSERRNSLRLNPHHTPPPIPPSLRQSPYLTSPVFAQDPNISPRPSDAAERWLQDTVPQQHLHSPADRRGSIAHRPPQHPPHAPKQPRRPSAPLTPVTDAAPARHAPAPSPRSLAAHSLAPPSSDAQPLGLLSPLALSHNRSVSAGPRPPTDQHGYFPPPR